MAPIRHITQMDNDTSSDCAWACHKMLQDAYTGASPSIRELATRYGRVNQFTTIAQLMRGLNTEGVPVAYTANATYDWYVEKWQEGVPVIGLLAMHAVRDNDGYPWAHFAVLTGVDSKGVVTFNPLKRQGPTRIPVAEFRDAIYTRSRYVGGTNNALQAVYPLTPLAAPVPSALSGARSAFDAIRGWAAA